MAAVTVDITVIHIFKTRAIERFLFRAATKPFSAGLVKNVRYAYNNEEKIERGGFSL